MAAYNEDLTLGKTTHESIWPHLCKSVGRQIDIGLLLPAFDSTPINAEVFDLARELRRRYKVGIITDNKADRIQRLRRFQKLDDYFSPIVVSAQVGTSKNRTAIFSHALALAAITPSEAIFVDNNANNLLAPSSLGIRTILHDDEKNDIVALRRNIQSALQNSASAA